MSTRRLSSRYTVADASSFIGTVGDLFYDPANGRIRLSDGKTPGGSIVSGSSSSNEGGLFDLNSAVASFAAYWQVTNIVVGDTIELLAPCNLAAFLITGGALTPGDNLIVSFTAGDITNQSTGWLPDGLCAAGSVQGQFFYIPDIQVGLPHSIVNNNGTLEMHINNLNSWDIDFSRTPFFEIVQFSF
jgi:hypothetical protein